ncbi:hypothetical protein EVAR_29387_1 [Eumeta japonica]|uniref:Histone-lysine N-methyltransferase SETMAR n=1 Tax=Eumeta variegata TaxID=151549 RepID=A0A4C1YES9_EUMVA|nr:hypothetical protein EVAR_29387_1 [Eumeta japonica]
MGPESVQAPELGSNPIVGQFKHGRNNLTDDLRDGHPSTATAKDNISVVRLTIETDKRITYQQIRISLGIEKSRLWFPNKKTVDKTGALVKFYNSLPRMETPLIQSFAFVKPGSPSLAPRAGAPACSPRLLC